MDYFFNLDENITEILTERVLPELYNADVNIVKWVQNDWTLFNDLMPMLSEHFTTAKIMDIYVPLVGAFRYEVMLHLVTLLACVNSLSSLIKWTIPTNRPYWWVREYNHTRDLQQFDGTCETTGAFPSSHCVSLMTFIYVINFSYFYSNSQWPRTFWAWIRLFLILYIFICMALSRIYLSAQFPSQCILTGLLVYGVAKVFERYGYLCFAISRLKAVLSICCLCLVPVCVYFGMQWLGLDPHWSVRMAFKWCAEPTRMRHEDSSIFILGRDFGYLMGVMFSMPLSGGFRRKVILVKRLPLLIGLEMVNYYARLETPKAYGRVVFVAYEFLRNATHSFILLSILQRITTIPRPKRKIL